MNIVPNLFEQCLRIPHNAINAENLDKDDLNVVWSQMVALSSIYHVVAILLRDMLVPVDKKKTVTLAYYPMNLHDPYASRELHKNFRSIIFGFLIFETSVFRHSFHYFTTFLVSKSFKSHEKHEL